MAANMEHEAQSDFEKEDEEIEDCPSLPPDDEIAEVTWNTLHTMRKELAVSAKKYRELHQIVHGPDGIARTVMDFGYLVNEVPVVKEENLILKREVEMLRAVVVKQSEDMAHMKERIQDLTTRSMGYNVLIHNAPEAPGEKVMKIVSNFFSDSLDVDPRVIDRAHRIGPKTQSTRSRMIVVRLCKQSQVDLVLSQAKSKLTRSKDALFVTPQSPPEVREARKSLYAVADKVKKEHPGANCVVKQNKLFVNNTLQRPALPTPTPRDILLMPSAEKQELGDAVKFTKGDPVRIQGNTFTAFVTPVKSMDAAREAYKAILLTPENMSATHTIACSALYNPFSAKLTCEHADDRDYGMGRELATHLTRNNARDIAVFVCRQYSGVHLGQDRFTAMKKAVDLALEKHQ